MGTRSAKGNEGSRPRGREKERLASDPNAVNPPTARGVSRAREPVAGCIPEYSKCSRPPATADYPRFRSIIVIHCTGARQRHKACALHPQRRRTPPKGSPGRPTRIPRRRRFRTRPGRGMQCKTPAGDRCPPSPRANSTRPRTSPAGRNLFRRISPTNHSLTSIFSLGNPSKTTRPGGF